MMDNCAICTSSLVNDKIHKGGGAIHDEEICGTCLTSYSNSVMDFSDDKARIVKDLNASKQKYNVKLNQIKSLEICEFAHEFFEKEIKELAKVLDTDEHAVNVENGVLHGNVGIIAITNQRLIFINKNTLDLETYPLYSTVKFEDGSMFRTIRINVFI